ncbi:MAG TPA: class I SAM-dependent methyltransferase [Bryobacteraceae bacterium]|jgi:SAM-dependent methyltransferase|nr:class I SAM-dependent methyltransferase [Bryobacteraceae bacterium]
MRKTYREKKSPEYWISRWNEIPVDAPAEGHDRYPLRYANLVVRDRDGEILELGCGPGRLLRYYHAKGARIVGVDNVAAAIAKLHACDPQLRVVHADARTLPFETGWFSTVLCFGVYHSLEDDVAAAISETFRVLRPGGRLCAEFRSDSLHNRMIDYFKGSGKHATEFHKWNYQRQEARAMLGQTGFVIESEYAALNMPLLYHVPLLRHPSQKRSDEHSSRISGYRLRPWVERLHSVGLQLLPEFLANEYIFVCRKPRGITDAA